MPKSGYCFKLLINRDLEQPTNFHGHKRAPLRLIFPRQSADAQLSHIYPIGNEAIVYRTGYNKRSLCFSRSFTMVQR